MRPRVAVVAALLVLGLAPAAGADDQRNLVVITLSDVGQPHVMRVIDANGATVRTVFSRASNSGITTPSWSRDEAMLAYSESQQIFTVAATGGAEHPLTTGSFPAFSPTGDEIAFWRNGKELWMIKPDGSGERLVAGPFNGVSGPPSWAPDGTSLAIRTTDGIVRLPAAGGGTSPIVVPGPGEIITLPALAPDGGRIAFARQFTDATKRDQLVVRDVSGGGETIAWQSTDANIRFASTLGGVSWSADSLRVAYAERDGTGSTPVQRLVTVNSDGTGGRKVLAQDAFLQGFSWANAPKPPNYYVKWIEITNAVSPDLPALPGVDPLDQGTIPFAWTEPALGGFTIPLIARKTALLRIYVGDSSLKAGTTAQRNLAFRVTGGTVGSPIERSGDVVVTAPDVPPTQTDIKGALNVALPAAAAAAGSPVAIGVEVNRDGAASECTDCYPNGNRAELQGVNFRLGGQVILVPVTIYIVEKDGTIRTPTTAPAGLLAGITGMLPAANDAVTLAPEPGDGIVLGIDELKTGALGWLTDHYACDVLLARLGEYRLITAGPIGPGAVRWMGMSNPPFDEPGVSVDCGGIANAIPGTHFILTQPGVDTAVHELGHTLGLTHTLGFGTSGGGAHALPYIGIGGAGYESPFLSVFDKARWGDIMSYSPNRWTSPASWQRMYEGILRESTPAALAARTGPRGDVARAAQAAQKRVPRRLVTGVIAGRRGAILRSLVAEAIAPEAAKGPLTGRIVARDRKGRVLASTPVRASGNADVPPFVVALPATSTAASLVLLGPKGNKPLDRLKASRHAPKGRFLKLPRRVRAGRPLTVRWRATDRDRDPLSTILQARRGKGAWRTIALGRARGSASVDPAALGKGASLRLRLRVADGLRTAVVKARPVRLRG